MKNAASATAMVHTPLMRNAHRQPDRPRVPSRFVDSAPCMAPESMAPVGWAML